MLISLPELTKRYNLKIKGVVHCGANKGQECDAYNEMGVDKVIWVEAIPEIAKELAANIEKYPNQMAVNACLGESDGREVVFNVSNNESQSSSYLKLGTHKIAHPEVKYVRHFQTTTVTLKYLLKEIGVEIGGGWLLCGDLQGSELDMLKGAGDLLNEFEFCYLEVNEDSLYVGCALRDEVEKYLSGYGFHPVERFIYEQWGWGDEFFIRNYRF